MMGSWGARSERHLAARPGPTRISSAPNILTPTTAAEIQVGQNIPIQTAAVSSTSSATGTVDDNTLVNNSFERQDVGVILKVTPQISEGDNVRLEVSNEITEVTGDSPVGLPTLTKRSIKNTVFVADGATVVIGGIISSKLDKSSNRVPWLGDIPGLGWAFKNKSKSLRKINLIVFLTPHIVRSPVDLRKVTNYKQKEFETKSREALRKTDEEERRERETKEKARAEGKSVEEYEEKYNIDRARAPVDQALKDIKSRNQKRGEAPDAVMPKATPGRHEEIIGAPESKAPTEDATGRVIAEERGEAPPAPRAPEPEPAAAPPRTASIPAGNYTVQVGAFPDRNQAQRLTDRLEDKHYDVYMTSGVVTGGGVVHRACASAASRPKRRPARRPGSSRTISRARRPSPSW
jgi:cell division septation protein DedD